MQDLVKRKIYRYWMPLMCCIFKCFKSRNRWLPAYLALFQEYSCRKENIPINVSTITPSICCMMTLSHGNNTTLLALCNVNDKGPVLLWCFLCCSPQQVVQRTIGLPVICDTIAPVYQHGLTLIPAWINNNIHQMYGMKLLIRYQNSTVEPSHTLLSMWLLS